MFVEERQGEIIAILNSNGNVKVKELSEKFSVTEDCIRKDLASLEKQGLLKRAYGGAVLLRANAHVPAATSRKDKNLAAKLIIAQKAIKLIDNNDTIFLDISTSNILLAKLIIESGKKVTVVTNMLDIVQAFTVQSGANVICVGGELNPTRDGFTGAMTINAISKFKFDISFIGVVGIDVYDNYASTYEAADGLTKNAAVKASKKAFLLCEAEKLSMDGNFKFLRLSDITGIIVEKAIEQEYIKALSDYNAEIV